MITGKRRRPWVIRWEIPHASDVFPWEFTTKREAERRARKWKREMVELERTPSDRAKARREYQWEVVQEG